MSHEHVPLVSVVIPTYNRGNVICRTIDNILEQTYPNIEIVIVDDGSTDDTRERLRPYGDRIRIIRQANAGPSAARNRGIEVARGEFVALQDSDDLWVSTKLERQVALLERTDESVVCCICDAVLRYKDRPEITDFERAWLYPDVVEGIWTNVPEVLVTRFVFFCQTVLIRRKVLDRVGGFDESLHSYHEDYELALRIALEGPWAFIRDPLTIWNQSPDGLSRKAMTEEIEMKECEAQIKEKFLVRVREGRRYESLRRRLRWELRRNYRELRIARLAHRNIPGTLSLSHALSRASRYCRAIYRRSPWYPMIEVQLPEAYSKSHD